MGNLSSINFKKSTSWQIFHNEDFRPSYAIGGGLECNRKAAEALTLKQEMINRAFERYTARTGQKPQAKNYEWSAVVNLKPSSTMQDLENLAQHLQDKYGLQCYQIAIHRDEGHINEQGEKVINHHAHLEFITLDKENGVNNFKRSMITRQVLRDMQSEVAEILGMERGIDKRLSGAKRIEPRVWAKMKEQEKGEREKLLENVKSKHEHELGEVKFKANQEILKYKDETIDKITGLETALNNEKKAHAATKKQLDELFETRRKEMIAEKDNEKKEYDELRTLKKELCNDENTTLEQALKAINELKERQRKDKEKIKELEKENKNLKDEIADLKDKEPAKTAENQKNDEILYTAEQIKDLFDFEYEINQEANTIDKDIKEFDKKENVLLPDAKSKKIKEISVNTDKLINKINKNTHLESLFSFENCKEKIQKAIKWLKDKGLSLSKTQNTGLQR